MFHYRVHIKPLEKAQAATSYLWRNDPEIWRYTGNRPDKLINQEIEEAWIEKVLSESNSKRFGIWVDDRYVGNIQLTGIVSGEKAEYHIFIGNKDFWGKGIAKLATFQLLRYAKRTLGLKEVFLKVKTAHDKGIRLYQACGFEEVEKDDDWITMKFDFKNKNIIPKISVFMMTYQHGKYLEKALNGILEQKCDFDFEIVVGDDFSKDNTREILKQYSDQYPGRFKLLFHSKNIGPYQNQNAVFKACEGEYLAICEGDDFWDDPNKLQRQVDFLDSNLDYVLSFHEVEKTDSNGELLGQKVLGAQRWKDLDQNQLISGDLVPSVSTVFRASYLKGFLDLKVQVKNGDTFLFAILGQYGKAHFHNDIRPAKYRIQGEGVWSGTDLKNRIESHIHTFEILRECIHPEFKPIVNATLFDRYLTQITRHPYPSKKKAQKYFKLWKFSCGNNQLNRMVQAHFTAIKNKLKN